MRVIGSNSKTTQRLVWTALALLICLWRGPSFVQSFWPTGRDDFFQDWASARNWYEGAPIYRDQDISAEQYLGEQPSPRDATTSPFNAHPPTSVLLALPLGRLDYSRAFLMWGVLSMAALALSGGLMARQFPGALSLWSVLPLAALLLLCAPLWGQVITGQLNLFLLLLITAAWAADRSGHTAWAGALLGAAAAIKLFPCFLFLYFLVRRQWTAVLAGAVSFALLTAITILVLGVNTYQTYFLVVLPSLEPYRVYWLNLSLTGYWHRLFNSQGSHVMPLWQSPALAWLGTLLCDAVLIGLVAWNSRQAHLRRECDLAFSLAMAGMLLTSPITWPHYFPILFLPMFVLWFWLPPAGVTRLAFWLLLIGMWIRPDTYWGLFIPGVTLTNWSSLVARPAQVLTALAMQTYLLLGLFALLCVALKRPPQRAAVGTPTLAARASPMEPRREQASLSAPAGQEEERSVASGSKS
jgi:hypothetical protein